MFSTGYSITNIVCAGAGCGLYHVVSMGAGCGHPYTALCPSKAVYSLVLVISKSGRNRMITCFMCYYYEETTETKTNILCMIIIEL